jgi:hypothetical protein
LNAFKDRDEPIQFIQVARETHVSEVAGGTTKYQISLGYSDGFGRELQSKLKVESGVAWIKQPDGSFAEQDTTNRRLASGRTVYNNKQKPIKQYEPFYCDTHAYQDEMFVSTFGVTPKIHYDPLLRVIQTDLPDCNDSGVSAGMGRDAI